MAKALFRKNPRISDTRSAQETTSVLPGEDEWRLMRARNKWQRPEECAHHPHPGTYPVVMTTQTDWGGWRVPGAEYDLYPDRIEAQARVMVNALRMATLIGKFVSAMSREGDATNGTLTELAREGEDLLNAMRLDER